MQNQRPRLGKRLAKFFGVVVVVVVVVVVSVLLAFIIL
jgi:hypothetical protein